MFLYNTWFEQLLGKKTNMQYYNKC